MLLLKYTHPHCSGLNFSFPLPNIGQIVFFHAKNKMDFLPQNNTFVQYPKIDSYLKYLSVERLMFWVKSQKVFHYTLVIWFLKNSYLLLYRKDHFPWIMKDYFLCFKTNKMLICRQCFRFSFVYDFEHYIFPDVQRGSANASEEGQRLLLQPQQTVHQPLQVSSSDLSKQLSEFCDREAASSITSEKTRQ